MLLRRCSPAHSYASTSIAYNDRVCVQAVDEHVYIYWRYIYSIHPHIHIQHAQTELCVHSVCPCSRSVILLRISHHFFYFVSASPLHSLGRQNYVPHALIQCIRPRCKVVIDTAPGKQMHPRALQQETKMKTLHCLVGDNRFARFSIGYQHSTHATCVMLQSNKHIYVPYIITV